MEQVEGRNGTVCLGTIGQQDVATRAHAERIGEEVGIEKCHGAIVKRRKEDEKKRRYGDSTTAESSLPASGGLSKRGIGIRV